MTPRIPVYSDKGTCNFCQAANRWGGEPHAPGCAFHQALMDITANGYETVEQAAAMLATERASRVAQRRKAAERYKTESIKWPWKDWELYLLAFTDTGILAPGETEQDLLKELEETGS